MPRTGVEDEPRMKLGITGTRRGMTPNQQTKLRSLLIHLGVTELHHGDCIGADEEAVGIAHLLGIATVCHPPEKAEYRAFTHNEQTLRPKAYIPRNQEIVRMTQELVAVPEGAEVTRSGTWSTVRYARKLGRVVTVLTP